MQPYDMLYMSVPVVLALRREILLQPLQRMEPFWVSVHAVRPEVEQILSLSLLSRHNDISANHHNLFYRRLLFRYGN